MGKGKDSAGKLYEVRKTHKNEPMDNVKPYRDYGAPSFSQPPKYQFHKEAKKQPLTKQDSSKDHVFDQILDRKPSAPAQKPTKKNAPKKFVLKDANYDDLEIIMDSSDSDY